MQTVIITIKEEGRAKIMVLRPKKKTLFSRIAEKLTFRSGDSGEEAVHDEGIHLQSF